MEYQAFLDNIYVVFVEAETPGNIGFLARAMKNFALRNLILINPCKLAHEAYFQASHARDIVDNSLKFDSLGKFLEEIPIDFIVGTTGMPGGSYRMSRIPLKPEKMVQSINSKGKIAFLFGREGDGLSNDEIELCDITVSIPAHPSYPVMNISHAAAIIFYELFKNQYEFDLEGLEEASLVEKNYLLGEMDKIVEQLDLPPHKTKTSKRAFKNIIGRSFITGREAHTLTGLLRRIKIKMHREIK
ncbi:MAG: TrmJ/YjtD family RNA methyltransferase [Euryarchaeota archaeon]|nr:TrmJ/YjtD family RNA methyltransferase [Euryarchaeota archaeon]MBU4608165.1 TrmJ/YjtD family RNA methyltransferase [Euryarchaeota archaeon]MBV1730208.1 TrmJ/YjtD family RNA methyltransferase [Methanobacterium sp.]MBV1754575.1 TrmJ/YjtD family RNA methyltransferase [Methanobacterium sp.]